jgi:hypothetical protein
MCGLRDGWLAGVESAAVSPYQDACDPKLADLFAFLNLLRGSVARSALSTHFPAREMASHSGARLEIQ